MRDGGATLEEIGDEFGISRERVRQLLERMNVDEQDSRMDPIALIRRVREDEALDSWRKWAMACGCGVPALINMVVALSMKDEVAALLNTRRANRASRRSAEQKQRLVTEVQALAGELGRSPRVREYRERYGHHAGFQRFFGNWNTLLLWAGLDPVPVGYPGRLALVA
jgi:hypothetical protein